MPPKNEGSPGFKARAKALGLKDAPYLNTDRLALVDLDALDVERVSDRRVPFTAQKAVDYINLPIWPGEREVSDGHVQFLFDEMKAGRFNWDAVVIAKCDLGDATYKINGQHTSWALLGLPEDSSSPQVREIHYRAKDASQLKALYSSFDRAKTRSDPHLTRVELVGSSACEGLTQHTISRLAPALRFWRFPKVEDYRRVGPAELAALIEHEHAQLFNTTGRFFQSLPFDPIIHGRIKRQPVLAAMLDNFSRVPTVAPEFWTHVAEGTGLEKDDARWHLMRYLDTVAINRSGANSTKKIVDGEEVYKTCVAAWNRWRKNEKVHSLRPTEKRVKSA